MKLFSFDVLIHPDSFFQRLITEDVSLRIPALIFFIDAIIGGISCLLLNSLVIKTRELTSLTGNSPEHVVILYFVIGFVLSIIFWLVLSGIIHFISWIFNGSNTFSRSLEVVAYGGVPLVIASFLKLLVAIIYIPMINVLYIAPEALNEVSTAAEFTAVNLYFDPAAVQLSQINMIITIPFILWSTYCWINGFKHARQISIKVATICVGVPVLLYWGFHMLMIYGNIIVV